MMRFFDANLFYGTANNVDERPLSPCENIFDLEAAVKRAGVKGGLVRVLASDISGAVFGNNLLREALRKISVNLYGMYTLLPVYTHEIPEPRKLHEAMLEGKFGALRVAPALHKYLPKPGILSEYYEFAERNKIPVVFNAACGITPGEVYDVMECFPKLTAVYSPTNEWPTDRYDRPFIARYPNLRLDLSAMMSDQGIEGLVAEYGAERIIFGSGFPEKYFGGCMMMVRHADISDADKEAIAGGNLIGMIKEAGLWRS